MFLASCSLFTPTQVSFNNTSTYTFQEIKIGSVDYVGALTPGSPTAYFPIAPGTYILYTRGASGALYQWPTRQQFDSGYSYQLVFAVDASNNLYYAVYVSMIQ